MQVSENLHFNSLLENCGMEVGIEFNIVQYSSITSDRGDELNLPFKHVNYKSILDYKNIFTKDGKCES